jgi:diguanylate cyclase (GGDEF)-like protein/PAS domain S-box-containing protein
VPIASGLLATSLLRGQLNGYLLPNLFNWFVSDALSLAIFTPAVVVFWTGEVTQLLRADRRRKTAFLLLLVCVITTGVFGQNYFPMLYWALPPSVLLAFEADLAGVLVGLLLCLAIAVSFTMRGSGPLWMFPYQSMEGRIFALQLFLVAALGIALPISATQAQRTRLFTLLREGERQYRILAENATDIVMSMALDGRLTYVSPRATVMGIAPEGLIGVRYPDLVLAEDRDALATAVENLAMGATEASQVSRFQHRDGQILWMETYLRPVIDPFGKAGRAHGCHADERRELHGLAFRDGLTGLFNRRHFDRELALQWRQEARKDDRDFVAVVTVDVDAYKSYNDRYGHQRGDDCLRTIAQTIASSAMRPADVVARYGGEEFALILKDTDEEGALVVAERIRQAVENLRIPHLACSIGAVTVSLGVAVQRPGEGDDGSGLLAAAARALYAAKRRGRNQTCMAGADDVNETAV